MRIVFGVIATVLVMVIFLLSIALPFAGVFTAIGFSNFPADKLGLTLGAIIAIVVAYLFIKGLRFGPIAGLAGGGGSSFILLAPLYLIVVGFLQTDLAVVMAADPLNLATLTVSKLAGGLSEEFVFRGFLQSVFIAVFVRLYGGIVLAVLAPAMIFGSLHLLNLSHESDVLQVGAQVIYAGFFGVYFGSALLVTRNLVALGIVHGVINLSFALKDLPVFGAGADEPQSATEALISVGLVCPLFVVGLIALLRIDRKEIRARLTN